MHALRNIAAKVHQQTIIRYQDALQSGQYDPVTKKTFWSDYINEKLSEMASLRIWYVSRWWMLHRVNGSLVADE